jgi:transposase InsO family protein
LSEHEERRLLAALTAPEHRDSSPRQVIPALAERGTYIASEATAYRVLRRHDLQHHRGAKKPARHRKPEELVATLPNQVWCWDITYLRTEVLGRYYYLYLVTDIFSRRVVAARVYEAEADELAAQLFKGALLREGIPPGQVVLHSDNGSAMKGATLKATLEKMGVLTSYSRPRVSDDNPYVESLFGTLKTRVGYPKRPFQSLSEAQAWVDRFVAWYNEEHRHSALNWVTPMARHRGEDGRQLALRRRTYLLAQKRHPARFPNGIRNCEPVGEVTLNPGRKRTRQATAA